MTTASQIPRQIRGARRDRRTRTTALPVSNRPAGFTLLELITALFVLTVGVLGAVHLYYLGLETMRSVGETSLVSNAIRNEVETLRAEPYAALRDGANQPFISVTPGFAQLRNLHSGVTIKDASDPKLRLKKITVSAAWTGEHGRTIRQSATTLLADKEGT